MTKNMIRRGLDKMRGSKQADQAPATRGAGRRRKDRLVNDTTKHAVEVVEQLGAQAAADLESTPRVRTRQQAVKRAEQRERGNRIRVWLQERADLARKARAKERKQPRGPRGVDRVPERYRDVERPTTWIVRHEPVQHPDSGRWLKGTPHRNPKRAAKLAKAGTLRKDLDR